VIQPHDQTWLRQIDLKKRESHGLTQMPEVHLVEEAIIGHHSQHVGRPPRINLKVLLH